MKESSRLFFPLKGVHALLKFQICLCYTGDQGLCYRESQTQFQTSALPFTGSIILDKLNFLSHSFLIK